MAFRGSRRLVMRAQQHDQVRAANRAAATSTLSPNERRLIARLDKEAARSPINARGGTQLRKRAAVIKRRATEPADCPGMSDPTGGVGRRSPLLG
jgi:hypothetical protein